MTAYTITKSAINVIINGESFVINRGNTQAAKIIAILSAPLGVDEAALREAIDLATSVKLYSDSQIEINKDGTVKFLGESLPDILARRVLDCFNDGVPYRFLLNHFNRLNANPSRRAKHETYKFLEHMGMPITPEGFFLGYKGVQQNYMDKWSGKFDNHPGNTMSMPRNAVCDDPDKGCSYGFHVGSLDYAVSWAGSHGRVVVVVVDPANVVSIPYDCGFQKLRTCEYKVIADYKGKLSDSAVGGVHDPYGTQFEADEDIEGLEDDIDTEAELDEVIDECYDRGRNAGACHRANGVGPTAVDCLLEFANEEGLGAPTPFVKGYNDGYRGV